MSIAQSGLWTNRNIKAKNLAEFEAIQIASVLENLWDSKKVQHKLI